MTSTAHWGDLRKRFITGGVIAVVGVGAMIAGGPVFLTLASLVCGAMVWEVGRMCDPAREARAVFLGLLATAVVMLAPELHPNDRFPVALIPPFVGLFVLKKHRGLFFLYALAIQVAGHGLTDFRGDHGFLWLLWLVLVVVTTDILGYFAGRQFGGPKFWPAVSPNKTWSGTAAGWIGAGVIGAAFLTFTEAGRDLIWISMLLSFASQMGDAAESALKRKTGVKDSSGLLPGHGGLYDRFDGLLGASLFLLLVGQFTPIPGLA